MRNLLAVAAVLFGLIAGSLLQHAYDHASITQARQNEMQANGLEDQCKAMLK